MLPALAAVTTTWMRMTPVKFAPWQNVFAGLATENGVCTSHSVVVEPLIPVPAIAISTEPAPGPATRNLNPCPLVPLIAPRTISAVQLSPAATAKERPLTSVKLDELPVQSDATRPPA